jgi:aminotransferase
VEVDFTAVSQLIRISGVSKAQLLSGWRIGWIIAPREIIAAMIKSKQYISTCSAWLSQKMAAFALADPAIESEVRRQLLVTRSIAVSALESYREQQATELLAIHSPASTPYLMIKVKDALCMVKYLITKGVITVPGQAFGAVSAEWIRINHAIPEPELRLALTRFFT